jgi:hypothetical protein
MNRNTKILCFVILILSGIGIPLKLLSQEPGVSPGVSVYGYVLLSDGDTLKGLVKWKAKYVDNNLAEINFTSKNGNSKIFNAGEILGFGHYKSGKIVGPYTSAIAEDENYVSIPSLKKGAPVFIYRFLDGRIRVFQHRSTKGMTSVLSEKPMAVNGISFSYSKADGLSAGTYYKTSSSIINSRSGYLSYLVSKDKDKLLEVNKQNYENVFQNLFGDCPEIMKEVERNPELATYKNFIILTEVYNQICKVPSK